jgi:hypothetical protein
MVGVAGPGSSVEENNEQRSSASGSKSTEAQRGKRSCVIE